MLKALIKKQFLELNQFYFTNRKTGKARSKGGAIGMIILFAAAVILIAAAFFGLATVLGNSLFAAGLDWLYFALFYLIAIVLGVFGSVFNTYSSLYLAKDNELLLSLPIPAGRILFVRMIGVGVMSLLYSAVAWVPAVINYWVSKPVTFVTVLFPVILTFATALFVTVLACVLGWVVARISVRMKHKTIGTVVLSVALLALYYLVYFRMNEIIQTIMSNQGEIADTIRTWIYPVYQFGLAACGQIIPLIITLAIIGVLFLIVYLVLSRSFIRITTSNKGQTKREYTEKRTAQSSIGRALLRKEAKRLTSSSTYLLNSCLGILIMIALTVFVAFNQEQLIRIADSVLDSLGLSGLILPIITAIICIIASMNMISAPSVSLEGQSIWILQSLPIETIQILRAKVRLHVLVNAVPSVLCTIVLGWLLHAAFYEILLMSAAVIAFIWLTGSLGLMMNLIKPNLNWKSEAVAVKQSISVLLTMLLGWGIGIAFFALSILARTFLSLPVYLAVFIVLFSLAAFLIDLWMKGKGSRIFRSL